MDSGKLMPVRGDEPFGFDGRKWERFDLLRARIMTALTDWEVQVINETRAAVESPGAL